MNGVSKNLRYLLWRENIPRAMWASVLSERIGCSKERAEELLGAGEGNLTPPELKKVAGAFGIGVETLRKGDGVPEGEADTLKENLRFLLGTLPHGSKKQFAAAIGVDAITVSRWASRIQRPPANKLRDICLYFGLSPGTDLAHDPVFLDDEPVGEIQKRKWILDRVNRLNGRTLVDLFPALYKILKD